MNGVLQRIEDEVEQGQEVDNRAREGGEEMLKDVESAAGVSILTTSSAPTAPSITSVVSGGSGTTAIAGSLPVGPGIGAVSGRPGERTPAAEKSVLSRVKRNYIYFSSLLQEPEAKWRQSGSFVA